MNAYIDKHGQVWVLVNQTYYRVGIYTLNNPHSFIADMIQHRNELAR